MTSEFPVTRFVPSQPDSSHAISVVSGISASAESSAPPGNVVAWEREDDLAITRHLLKVRDGHVGVRSHHDGHVHRAFRRRASWRHTPIIDPDGAFRHRN